MSSNELPCLRCPHLPHLLQNPSAEWFAAAGWSAGRVADAIWRHRSTVHRWFQSGNIPPEGRNDLARLALSIVHEGCGRHDG